MEIEENSDQNSNKTMINIGQNGESKHSKNNSNKDDITVARQKIETDKYDIEAWKVILSNIKTKNISECQDIYEECVKIFPSSSFVWINYYENALKSKNYELLESLFQRCTEMCCDSEIWNYYIKYIVDHVCKDENGESRNKRVIDTYEYALQFIGMDINSSTIWLGYLDFLKSLENNKKNQDKIIDVYSRALSVPIHNLEVIQKDFLEYKKKFNLTIESINESNFETVIQVFNDRANITSCITFSQFPRPPKGLQEEIENVKHWKTLLEYEKSNPQKLDQEQLNQRILFTFNKALSQLLFYPEFWYMFATYKSKIGTIEDVIQVYETSLKFLPRNLLLLFQYCEILESTKNFNKANSIYENLIHSNPQPLVWIQYMYFTSRVYGKKKMREVFLEAIKSATCTYHIYVAAALHEYYANKEEKVARNIFELGLKRYDQEIPFLLQYIEFLIYRNEENDMRVLFEKVLKNFKLSKSEIWSLFLRFESQSGTLETASKIIKRRSEAYPKLDPYGIFGMIQRYNFLDLWPCTHQELSSFVGFEDEVEETYEYMEVETEKEEEIIKNCVMPDLVQLSVYRKDLATMKMSTSSALSKTITQFMNRLPPSQDWDGPSLNIDKLMDSLRDVPIQFQQSVASTTYQDEDDDDYDRDNKRLRRTGNVYDVFARRMISKKN